MRVAGHDGSALAMVMRIWVVDRLMEFHGGFAIKLSTTALAMLFSSGSPELASIEVGFTKPSPMPHALPEAGRVSDDPPRQSWFGALPL
jgi:hypothetical protein